MCHLLFSLRMMLQFHIKIHEEAQPLVAALSHVAPKKAN